MESPWLFTGRRPIDTGGADTPTHRTIWLVTPNHSRDSYCFKFQNFDPTINPRYILTAWPYCLHWGTHLSFLFYIMMHYFISSIRKSKWDPLTFNFILLRIKCTHSRSIVLEVKIININISRDLRTAPELFHLTLIKVILLQGQLSCLDNLQSWCRKLN